MIIITYFKRLFTLQFYAAILQGKQRFNIFLAIFLLSLAWVTSPTITLYTKGYVFAQGFESQVSTLIERVFPDELEITIQEGIVSTNVPEPYYITLSPDTFKGTFLEDSSRTSDYSQRLLAIDTNGRAEDFERYQAAALLTDRSLVYYNDEKIRIQPLREVEDMVITKKGTLENFNEFTQKVNLGKILRIGVIVLPFLMLLGMFIAQLVAALLVGILVWVLLKIHNPNVRYRRAVVYGVAISFVPDMLAIIAKAIPNAPSFISVLWDYNTMICFVLAYMGSYFAMRQEKQEETL